MTIATLYDEIDHVIDLLGCVKSESNSVTIDLMENRLRYIRDNMPSYDFDVIYTIWRDRKEELGFKDESENTVEECRKWLISQVEEMW